MKLKLNQYSNSLTEAQIAAGMNAAVRNAARLLDDANILLQASRFPSAAALAILSIEESGKVSILREMALTKNADEAAKTWKRYRSHTQKNVAWLLPQLVASGARRLDEFRALFDTESGHPHLLDQVKQIAFYTDCLGQANWSEPSAVIDEGLARQLLTIAGVFSRKPEVTVQEIELWVKHLKPAWPGPADWMKKALLNWRAAMKQAGLASGDAGWEEFLQSSGVPGRDA